MSDPAPLLAEVSEADARGAVAEIYDDIRRVTGVSTVALVHRALAVDPRGLAAIWSDLAPNLADPEVRAAAARLGTSHRHEVELAPVSAARVERSAARVTLAAFDRINRLNVVGLSALLDGVDAPATTARAATAPDPISGGLAMADVGGLPAGTIELLKEMSVGVTGGGTPVVISSLYRFFAHDHELLSGLWTAIRPVVESDALAVASLELRAGAQDVVAALPFGVRVAEGRPARAIVERFLVTIPSMIVVSGLLDTALGLSSPVRGGSAEGRRDAH